MDLKHMQLSARPVQAVEVVSGSRPSWVKWVQDAADSGVLDDDFHLKLKITSSLVSNEWMNSTRSKTD